MAYLLTLLLVVFSQAANCANDATQMTGIEATQPVTPILELTEEEKQWLTEHNDIRIAYDGSLPPYSFVNDEGKIDGVAVEIINVLSQRLGINFTVFPDYNWSNLYKAAAKRKVDVVATMVSRSDRAVWFRFTKPYLTKSLVIVTKHDDTAITSRENLDNKRVAVVKGYQYADQIITEFPSIKLTKVDSMLAGLRSVSDGQVDAAIIFLGTVNYLQSKYALNNLRIAAFYDRNNANESIAIRKDWPILAQVLQKGLDSLPEEEVQKIFAKWVVGGGLPAEAPPSHESKQASSPVAPLPAEPIKQGAEAPADIENQPPPVSTPDADKLNMSNLAVALVLVAALYVLWMALVRKQRSLHSKSKNVLRTSPRNLQSERNDAMHLTIEPAASLENDNSKSQGETHRPQDIPMNEDISYHKDCEGRITYVSPNLTNLLGYYESDFIGNFRKYLTDNPANHAIDEQIEKIVQGQPNESYEIELYDAGQSVHWFQVVDTPIYDGLGHCTGLDGVMRDITAQKLYEKVSVKAANQDSSEASGILQNLHLQIKDAIHAAAQNHQNFVLIYIQLDKLRSLNGELIHSSESEVLDEAARRLKATLRDTDKVIQIEKNSFALILPDTDASTISLVIEKIRKILQVPYLMGVHSIVIDVNLGIAVYPKDGSDSFALINEAQILLPVNEIEFSEKSFAGKINDQDDEGETLELQQSLLAALDECKLSLRASSKQNINALHRHSQLSIYYQSRHSLEDYSITGFEALVRWRHPQRGLLLPLDFVPLIKGIGLLDIMTYWILQQVCFQAVKWEAQGIRPKLLTINLNDIGIKKTLEPNKILAIIEETGAKPDWLALSIPENEIAKHPDLVLPIMNQLKESGLVLSVDNFGTDSNFLSRLDSIPAQLIEVDPFFVRDVSDNYTNPEIITHTVSMLKEQGRTVIIKEIETEAQLDFLRTTGCDIVQGHLLSRAVPSAEAKELMETFPDVAWYFQQK